MNLSGYTEAELTARNLELGAERQRIREEQLEINAELSRRHEAMQAARAYMRAPANLQALMRPQLDSLALFYLADLEHELDADGEPQSIAPVGVESLEAVGTPGRKWWGGRR